MALTYGFYNSIEGDRKYDATQVSRIFDGIIKDGVYATYEKALMVIASENAGEVIIQPGRAWFNHTWSYNDANLIMQAPAPEVLLDRIDALVLEVNEELAVRANSFKWVQGTPSSRPENPTLTNTATIHQYPLCYVHRYPETTMIYTRDITITVGTSECPFATGVLEGIDLDAWINQWDDEFHSWENNTKTSFETWMLNQESVYTEWAEAMRAQMDDDMEDLEEWLAYVHTLLTEEAATNLQLEIDELREEITSGSHIFITTPETELYGRDVTITTEEDVVFTEAFDQTGVAEFKSVPYVGNLSVESSYGSQTAESVINTPYYGRYRFRLAFWAATVNIVGDPELAGQTVTIKNSNLVIVGTVVLDSEGLGVFTASEPDTYLFILTYGGETMEVTLSVTQETTYTVTIHAQGSVTLAGWLTAGSTTEHPINPSSYSTFADVEANEEVVRQLMTVHNAVDYLATSDGTDELIGQVINSDICAKWINLRDYALDTLSANVAVKALMDTADKYGYGEWALMPQVPKMTQYNTPYGEVTADTNASGYYPYLAFDGVHSDSSFFQSYGRQTGHWIQYKFISPVCINHFYIIENATSTKLKLQGSNDGTTFTDIGEYTVDPTSQTTAWKFYHIDVDNSTAYTYYRLVETELSSSQNVWAISVLQLYAWQPKGNVPIMTSDTAPYGVAIGTNVFSSSYAYYYAFDNVDSTRWLPPNTTANQYVGYKFSAPVCVKRAIVTLEKGSNPSNITMDVIGSNDGTTWSNPIGTATTSAGQVVIDCGNNDNFYLQYALTSSGYWAQSSTGYWAVKALQFYGRELSVSVPTMTSDTAPYGEVIIETISGSSPTTYPAWRVFDGDESTNNGRFNTYSSSVYTLAFGYDFKKPVCIKYVRNVGYLGSVGVTVNATIQGSNDGTNWTDLGEIQLASTSLTVTQTTLNNTDNFRYYRIVGTAVKTGNYYYVCTQELQFYGLDYSEREFAEGSTMKYLYDHGVELEELEGYVSGEKGISYLKATTANHGGWQLKNTIDLTPYSLFRAVSQDENSPTVDILSVQGGKYGVSTLDSYGLFGAGVPNNISLDISTYNEPKYVGFLNLYSGTNYTNIRVQELWLE